MDVLAYDEKQRPYVARFAVIGLAVLAAVVGAGLALLLHTSAPTATGGGEAGSAANPPANACAELRSRADVVLHDAQVLAAALAQQTGVMNDLLAHRLSVDQALNKALPTLTRASQQTVQLNQDAGDYASIRRGCSAS